MLNALSGKRQKLLLRSGWEGSAGQYQDRSFAECAEIMGS